LGLPDCQPGSVLRLPVQLDKFFCSLEEEPSIRLCKLIFCLSFFQEETISEDLAEVIAPFKPFSKVKWTNN